MFFRLFCRAPRMRITGLVAMLVIVFVGVTVAVIVTVVVRMAIAMVVTVRMIVIMGVIVTVAVRMPVIMGMIVAVRMIVVVVAGLASRMVMSAACRGPCLSLLGKQLLHALFEVGVRFGHEVVNHGYRLETRRFQRTQQGVG
jgi:hypothetical protein